ncbi:MAG: hypothetical protein OXF08_10540 [Bacteroidetes bacterium]|nr:hypothetical protein [Bacteroidota bacterium]
MDNPKDTHSDLFSKVKDSFKDLELEQKAVFLVTESVNTAVEALTTAADRLADEFTQFFNSSEADAPETEKDSPEDPSA